MLNKKNNYKALIVVSAVLLIISSLFLVKINNLNKLNANYNGSINCSGNIYVGNTFSCQTPYNSIKISSNNSSCKIQKKYGTFGNRVNILCSKKDVLKVYELNKGNVPIASKILQVNNPPQLKLSCKDKNNIPIKNNDTIISKSKITCTTNKSNVAFSMVDDKKILITSNSNSKTLIFKTNKSNLSTYIMVSKKGYTSKKIKVNLMSSSKYNKKYRVLVNNSNMVNESKSKAYKQISFKDSMWGDKKLEKETYRHYLALKNHLASKGYYLYVRSGYRTYDESRKVYNESVQSNGIAYANAHIAKPGYSEHNLGIAFDFVINSNKTDKITNYSSNAYKELLNVADKYGFIIRYPENKSNITKINYEPWHFRYVGVELASHLKNNKLTLEEYYKK